jgi:putative toxin-antitoxin system antitoxin component (TIGR02293 family)
MAVPRPSSAPNNRKTSGPGSLGLKKGKVLSLVKVLQGGLSFATFLRFQRNSGLSPEQITKVLRIPPRTLARRKVSGALTTSESERLVRLASLFDKAVDLFEGNRGAARDWLQAPNKALGNQPPLTLAETEIGGREVEDLIGRLEYGVYS